MGADNFEQLGFQVKVDGATDAVSHLDDIISRLERIQKLNKKVGATSNNGGKSGGLATTNQILGDDLAKAQAQGIRDNYKLALKHARLLAQITDPAYKKVYDMGLQVKAIKNQIETSNYLPSSEIESNTTAQNENTKAVNKNKEAIKNKVNAQKQEEKQTKRNTQSLTSYFGKLTSTVVIARKFARVISSAIQESANYVENLNLFAVAYGDVYQETLDWALNIADGFGLANNEVLKFAGTFRQLSTSLGLVEDTANSVSKTVTELGYDMSALFNTSVTKAMDKLQSSIFSGNVRPLRAYGIDISQTQIDALFETTQALASLGVNARNLSQSDKVLARLIITLRDGANAFGTMNREINTLQSQIRILQGSFSNFKLAIGDLVYEPVRKALVVVNAFIMAVTNIIRKIKPLQTEDKNNIFNGVAIGAEEANSEIDELNGKLADFDKFNVLGGQSQGGASSAVTEALTAELAKQQEYYEQQVDLMDDIQNEAKELAKSLEPLIIGFGVLATILAVEKISSSNSWFLAFASKETGDSIAKIATSIGGLTKGTQLFAGVLKTLTGPVGIILAVVGVLYATNEEFRESINSLIKSIVPLFTILFDLLNQILQPLMPLISGILNLVGIGLSYVVKVLDWTSRLGLGLLSGILYPLELIIKALSTVIELFRSLFTLDFSNLGKNLSNLWSNWATTDFAKKNFGSLGRFADGGYTNANLIMTHENGKREWVGKAAGSSAIVNDTQMSDIMEVAVAKGVYQALSARSAMGGNVPTNETIVVKIGEEAVFNAVRKTARRQGRDFANV